MRLEGWNNIPRGYGAHFDVAEAPWWLRAIFRSPLIDRFAYPMLVSRGYGWLTEQPGMESDPTAATERGWRIDPSSGRKGTRLVATSAASLRWRRKRYAFNARRHRLSQRVTLPPVMTLPGGMEFRRHRLISWRVRGPALVLAVLAGWRLLGRAGALVGAVGTVIAELVLSYGRRHGTGQPRRWPPDDGDDGSAGVREPRHPLPVVSSDASPLPTALATP
jgi:hypothetical protein